MSEPLKFSAGEFEVVIWAGGWPSWWSIRHKGKAIADNLDHRELKDLMFCLQRAHTQARAAMEQSEHGTSHKHAHEFD